MATYTGKRDVDEEFEISPSSDSTARQNPTIVSTVRSAHPKSRFGWYSRPVTVRFACKAGSAAVASCPKPVHVTRDGITTISRTVHTVDGGAETITVTVKLDQVRPTLVINKNGTITAKDGRSGIARTKLYKTVRVHSITYYAWATVRAGNTTAATRKVARG